MLKVARHASTNANGHPILKIAVLSDNSTQQITKLLKASLLARNFWPEIYEADFDTMQTEVFNPDSKLFSFSPQYVWLNLSMQNYRERFYSARAKEKETMPSACAAEIFAMVGVLSGKGCQVIVNLLAAPLERYFGNYSPMTLYSLHSSIAEVNRLLVNKAANTPQCFLNDVAFSASQVGLENWHDERLWSHSKYMCAPKYFPLLTESVADVIKTTRGKLVKCLALDLDNTLWGGIVGDDGIDNIEIGGLGAGESFERFQKYLLELKGRGIVLAVCSKNDEAVALEVFRKHPAMILREKDIAVFVANWNAKSANLAHVAKVLNFGLDTIAFIDDSAFERNEVRTALPSVIVPEMPEDPSLFAAFLESENLFETTTFSEDDRKRAQMYKEEAARTTLQISAVNIDDYLRSLDMRISCEPLDSLHMTRVVQLLQRSNQFNLRTQRFSEAKCRELMNNFEQTPSLQVKLRDKFGDYGLISVVCAQVSGAHLEILEYVMSCRVLNRGVEQYVMTFLANLCRSRNLSKIVGEFIPTEKNKMVAGFYQQFGFKAVEQSGSKSVWELTIANYVEPKCYIQKENPNDEK